MALSLARAAFAILIAMMVMAIPGAAQKGKTIFGDNQVETIRAMKKIVKSIGVKNCTYCHVKEDGKPRFDLDTPKKNIALQMKLGFVDSLVSKGRVELMLPQSEYKTEVIAVYRPEGDSAGIHLTATIGSVPNKGEQLPDGVGTKIYSGTIALPKEGESITCMTCHNRSLRFLTASK